MTLKRILLIRTILFVLLWKTIPLFGNIVGADDPDPPEPWDGLDGSKDDIKEWWQDFQSKYRYPLYCIVLASATDTEAVQLLLNHNGELDQISGSDCCFIFFRDMSRRKNFEPYIYSEYSRRIYPFARFIGIDFNKFPCLLFFQQVDSGRYIHVSLQGLSQQEIIVLVRNIMTHIHQDKNSSQFNGLKHFKSSQTLRKSSKELGTNVLEIGKTTLLELLKSLIAFHK